MLTCSIERGGDVKKLSNKPAVRGQIKTQSAVCVRVPKHQRAVRWSSVLSSHQPTNLHGAIVQKRRCMTDATKKETLIF